MKTVKEERLSIILTLTRSGGVGSVEVEGRADYEVSSDDLTETRSIQLDLIPGQVNAVKSLATQVLAKIKQKEKV